MKQNFKKCIKYHCSERDRYYTIVVHKPFINPVTSFVTTSETHLCLSDYGEGYFNYMETIIKITSIHDPDYNFNDIAKLVELGDINFTILDFRSS